LIVDIKYVIVGLKMLEFSQILKKERTIRGWSQAMMAQELGTTPNTVSAWERGLSLPSPYFRTKLCELLGKNAIELNLISEDEQEQETQLIADPQPPEPVPIVLSTTHTTYEKLTPSSEKVKSASLPKRIQASWWTKKRWLVAVVSALLVALVVGGGTFYLLPGLLAPTNPYGGRGSLAVNDTLQQQSTALNWQEGWNENRAACQFKQGAYYSYQPLEGYFHACIAQGTNFTNFAYEVDMVLLQGDYGGIIFRAIDSAASKYYYLRIYADGSYMLKRYVSKADDDAYLLHQGRATSFKAGYGKHNQIAVVAEANQLSAYVNGEKLVTANDAAYGHGQIGVFAGNDNHTPAEAAFSNARVWSW
ncbi:helix-turn-helix domain-containing protein, partial [Ktedonospora formicarum]|uniref:helix-turn-helix domain-containing protein n=1 Tax=Ktedonospora formicarum TaxID=2778364 RepID=UPI001C68A15A